MRYAVDGILYRSGKLLLIKRAGRTFHDHWALPGGILDVGEMVEQTLVREMFEELGVTVHPLEILGVYSHPDRDPREHTISVVFICDYKGEPTAGDDAADWGSFSLKEALTLDLAFDHKKIIEDFVSWIDQPETYWSSKNT